ncbi:hypothetical protein Ancab_006496, partial [Ancistrocladus abbreviatus]
KRSRIMTVGTCSESNVRLRAQDDSSCSNWHELSNDLVIDILCRLPDTSLIKCKCVCKQWKDLITNVCIQRVSASASLSGIYYTVTK